MRERKHQTNRPMRERRDDDVILTMTNFFQITLLPTERLIFTLSDNLANTVEIHD